MPRRDVILIDDDPRRRAHIRAMLECIAVSNAGYCRSEWLQRLDPPGLIFLVADSGRGLEKLVTTSRDLSINAAVIAFAAKPRREDNLRAFGLGVSDYLHWPLCARDCVPASRQSVPWRSRDWTRHGRSGARGDGPRAGSVSATLRRRRRWPNPETRRAMTAKSAGASDRIVRPLGPRATGGRRSLRKP